LGATNQPGGTPRTQAKQRRQIIVVKKGVTALAIALVGIALFALCLVSAIQLLEPRDMPFGVTGSSPVVGAVQHKDPDALDLKHYSSEADLINAAERGDIYGGYIRGRSADTVVTVPAKSFFGEIYVRGAFADAAKKTHRAVTTKTIAPLPTSDRTGAVGGLLLLPTLIGGYLIATMLFTVTQSATAPGRIAIILGFSVAVALITGAAALAFGAVPTSHIWALLPCFALVTAAVALAGSVIQHFLGKMGTLLMAVLFIVIGGAGAGGSGISLLPSYWQTIGALFPPRHAVELYRNVRYFDGHNIGPSIAVLSAYALIGPPSSSWPSDDAPNSLQLWPVPRRRCPRLGASGLFRRTSEPRSRSRCCSARSSRSTTSAPVMSRSRKTCRSESSGPRRCRTMHRVPSSQSTSPITQARRQRPRQ
jgi:hypothetical protein